MGKKEILTILFFINLIYPTFCTEFRCYFDICDTKDNQFCNEQDKRCNYCGIQQCITGLKKCEDYCQSLKTTTSTTEPATFLHSLSPPYVQSDSSELWWKIFLVIGVVGILAILGFVVDNHRRLHCNKKPGGDQKADGNVVEKNPLLNGSEDSGLDHSPDGSNTAIPGQQNRPQELKNLTRGERVNQLQDQLYDHGQAKLIPGTNRSINPQRPINAQGQQPHTSPELCTENNNKFFNERMDADGLSIHKNGRLLNDFSLVSNNDETNLKHTI